MVDKILNPKASVHNLDSYEIEDLINNGYYGVLGTVKSNIYPYTVPMNYIYYNNKIYLIYKNIGNKIKNIKENNNVSFVIVGDKKLVPQYLDTEYKSVLILGLICEVRKEEKYEILIQFIKKYAPEYIDIGKIKAYKDQDIMGVYEIKPTKITGKTRRF